jgi:hypothetical protein
MSLTTPLEPFFKEYGVPFTTADVINIESQLGYTYGAGSLDGYVQPDAVRPMALAAEPQQKTVHVAGIDRSKIRGSFLIATWADLEGKKELVGIEPVLSRWQVIGCANCQTRLRVSADTPLPPSADPGSVTIEIHTRDGLLGTGPSRESAGLLPMAHATAASVQQFTVESAEPTLCGASSVQQVRQYHPEAPVAAASSISLAAELRQCFYAEIKDPTLNLGECQGPMGEPFSASRWSLTAASECRHRAVGAGQAARPARWAWPARARGAVPPGERGSPRNHQQRGVRSRRFLPYSLPARGRSSVADNGQDFEPSLGTRHCAGKRLCDL